MDTQALQAFVAVVEVGSFSKAAEQLFLTQPAITKRIQGLESQLDTRLFDRFQRRIVLTEAGKLLLPSAQLVLQQLKHTQTAIQNLSGRVSGKLALATSHHIGLHRIPGVLRNFSRNYPEVELDLHFIESEKAYEAVISGVVEIAFVTLSPDLPSQIDSEEIWRDSLLFVAAPGHPLTTLEQPRLTDLALYNAILPAQNTHTYRIVHQRFEREQIPLRAVMPTNYLETIKMMVSVGMGWSVLPESMLDASLSTLPVDASVGERQLGAILHSGRVISNAARAILEEARNHAQ